jgi:ethylbenzene hydroxylase subunit beta/complex iron-sulfur molybdoenzyme family reductase subunit beta
MGTITTSKRQLAWVFDLNKCIGCQTCSVACKVLWPSEDEGTEAMWWMTVNTQPGEGTPRGWEGMGGGYRDGELQLGRIASDEEIGGGWDFNYDEVLRGGHGRSRHLKKISGSESWGMNWDEDEGGGEFPNAYYFYLPRLCNHCTRPACLEACPNDAIFKREEDGLVLRDEDACQGAQQCRRACPYKKIYFNRARNVSQHCIGCFPRIEQGVAPACVRQCPGRAAFIGFDDDEGSPVEKLVRKWKVALPLHPDPARLPGVAVRVGGPRRPGRPAHGAGEEAARSGVRADGHPDPLPLEGRPGASVAGSGRHPLGMSAAVCPRRCSGSGSRVPPVPERVL